MMIEFRTNKKSAGQEGVRVATTILVNIRIARQWKGLFDHYQANEEVDLRKCMSRLGNVLFLKPKLTARNVTKPEHTDAAGRVTGQKIPTADELHKTTRKRENRKTEDKSIHFRRVI